MLSDKRVLVAMSGGIDSSMAAALLHEQGYEVIGLTMKTWDYTTSGGKKRVSGCCGLDDINDAREVAVTLGFTHSILDIRATFGNFVIDRFTKEYLNGRTPNPCVLCNTHIKWEALLERANQLGCAYIATGHYAQVRHGRGRYWIAAGKDRNKDQSYALWGLSQASLARTLFPLGQFTKPEIRKMAEERGFMHLAKKAESYEICFVPDNDYRGFLKRNTPGLEDQVAGGEFVLEDGTVVGRHQGYPFYTIGQRKGLGVAFGKPMYVIEIQAAENRVVLGTFDELSRDGMYVKELNLMKYPEVSERLDTITKIRYNDQGAPAVIEQEGGTIKVFFGKGVHAIAPGQAAVFYEGDEVIGGGWITASFAQNRMR